MGASEILLKERAALCDTFDKYGAEAPTLCEGWLTLELAAHLVAREARSDAAIGLIVPAFAGHLQRVMDSYKTKGYDTLVGMLRTGPPWMHRTGPLATANVNENFIHHEDVRRASGEGPRSLDPDMSDVIWKMLGFGVRKKRLHGVAVSLRTPDGREKAITKQGEPVVMTGEPGELALFMAGRKEAAVVTHDGHADAVAIVIGAEFGI